MTVNCRSVVDKIAELAACINYTKPDIICGTESWLKGIQPGKPTRKDAIKSSEVFPKNFKIYRNDRGTLGGGVFVGIHEELISTETTSIITECEIEWSKVKLKNNKDLHIASFYMPHRNMKDLDNLRLSLDKLTNGKPRHVIIAGDFNCPDIDWVNMEIKTGASDREVQQALLDITSEYGLTQIHDKSTREGNMLDLVFTNNPSLIKRLEMHRESRTTISSSPSPLLNHTTVNNNHRSDISSPKLIERKSKPTSLKLQRILTTI
jgi:hypothetical protein